MAANEDMAPEAIKTPRIARLTLIPENRAALEVVADRVQRPAPMGGVQKDREPNKQEDEDQTSSMGSGCCRSFQTQCFDTIPEIRLRRVR